MIKIIAYLSLLFFLVSPIRADWVKSLGGIGNSAAAKQSYMLGLLLQQTYGSYSTQDLRSEKALLKFYEQRDYKTFWFNGFNEPRLSVVEMLEAIKRSQREGLDSSKYHYDEIKTLYDDFQSDRYLNDKERNLAVITLDILLSDAFFSLATDLYEGLIDYKKFKQKLKTLAEKREIKYSWDMNFSSIDPESLLKKAARSMQIEKTLYDLVTRNYIYENLLEAYHRYKEIVKDGGFVKIPSISLKEGSRGNAVKLLAKRLFQSDDLDYYDDDYIVFDKQLKEALKRFQKRMGFWPSGTLDRKTRIALNVPASRRAANIKLNLERARWEKDSLDYPYVFVNIPSFMMYFKDGEENIFSMRVVVGSKKNPTPIFKAYMSYVVLNPTWSVPQSIVKKEMLARLQEDPDYLSERKFKAYDGWSKNRKEIDPFDIDWYQFDKDSDLPFNIVKDPGAGNPLGRVKFMFPNKYAVYMHDTNEKKLFKRPIRAYSHGCIRLQQPQKMLEFISENYLPKSYDSIKAELKKGENSSIQMKEKIPVYIRYYTVWSDQNGLNFRNDIYGYDKAAAESLR